MLIVTMSQNITNDSKNIKIIERHDTSFFARERNFIKTRVDSVKTDLLINMMSSSLHYLMIQ